MATVKSAERTLRLLKIIVHNRNGMLFTEIQMALGMPKSSTHSLIQELIESDYLMYSDTTNRYYVGSEFVKICAICLNGTDLLNEFQILSSELAKRIGQTTHVSALDRCNILYMAKYETTPGISSMNAVGFQIPANCTATGKMLLSQYSNEQVIDLYKDSSQLPMLTERSINRIDDLIKQLDEVRKQGYALEMGEAKEFAACIAMPLYQKNKMIAAFSVTYSLYEFQTANMEEITAIMKEYKEITEQRLVTV